MGRDSEQMHGDDVDAFQPTRPYGARRYASRAYIAMFQPTRPYGARPRRNQVDAPVSTHAPLWGATIREAVRDLASSFNPRAPMGRDERAADVLLRGPRFQPTRPYGARLAGALTKVSTLAGFNPRAPMGRDAVLARHLGNQLEFQPTRPYGARRRTSIPTPLRRCFNPRAPMGRDLSLSPSPMGVSCFNPRAPMGRDFSPNRRRSGNGCFNPRAPMGRDVRKMPRLPFARGFNPRAPMGRDGGSRKA